MAIPERKPGALEETRRKFYTELDGLRYLEFEREAMARGVTTYELAKHVMTDWLETKPESNSPQHS